jgi:Cdc6-like AAA superfamily ATPase
MVALEIEGKLSILNKYLSPERPIRNLEYLRGRGKEFETLKYELSCYSSIPFIYGNRGVGKTSLARTAAQMVTASDREHIYAACSPDSNMLSLFRSITQDLLNLAIKLRYINSDHKKTEIELSLKPGIRFTFEHNRPRIAAFEDINEAITTFRDVDSYFGGDKKTVIIVDEIEEMQSSDKTLLAHFIKQCGDQEFNTRLMIVGIASSVHDLIGTHASIPRYICEISLSPLSAQDLIDIVKEAAKAVNVVVNTDILYRIAIIGDGYPHFAHLIGKSLLHEVVVNNVNEITNDIYKNAISRAVRGSIEELTNQYNTATQRKDDVYRHLVWAMADSDYVDLRTDDLFDQCKKVGEKLSWILPDHKTLSKRLTRLGTDEYGKIVVNTPKRCGSDEKRYRYKRFSSSLMRGHVRLIAENEGFQLGGNITL